MAEKLYRVCRNCVSGDTIIRCSALREQMLYYIIVLPLEIYTSNFTPKRKLCKLIKNNFRYFLVIYVLYFKIYVSKMPQR